MRWNHPTRGVIGPDDFIPIAEDTGLIIDLGRFVLREACRQTMRWRHLPGAEDLSVSVNVSPHQIYDDNFVTDVATALEESGLPATSLILELTETALLTDAAPVQQRLGALQLTGVRIAIDDFGTGYSSLAYLRSFAIDFLKIDRSFVNELTHGHRDQGRAMVRSIINIGRDLELHVIAEGIEEDTQLDVLRDAGCTTGQGYLFAKPAPADQIPDVIRRSHQAQLASHRSDA